MEREAPRLESGRTVSMTTALPWAMASRARRTQMDGLELVRRTAAMRLLATTDASLGAGSQLCDEQLRVALLPTFRLVCEDRPTCREVDGMVARLTCLVFGVALLLQGCSGSAVGNRPSVTGGTSSESPTSALVASGAQSTVVPGTTAAKEIPDIPVSVFDNFLYAGKSLDVIEHDKAVLIADCMRNQGWQYTVADVPAVPFNAPNSLPALVQYRSAVGYNIVNSTREQRSRLSDQNEAFRASLAPAAQRRYIYDLTGGVSESEEAKGCVGAAQKEVATSVPAIGGKFADAGGKVLTTLLADSRFVEARAAWANCMNEFGYTYDGAAEPEVLLGDEFHKNRPSDPAGIAAFADHELKVAAADVTCYVRHVALARYAVEREIVQQLVESGELPTKALSA
jgi:hypothetical protein